MDVEFIVKIPRDVLVPPAGSFCRKRLSDRIRDYAADALAEQHPKVYAAAVAVSTSTTASRVAPAATSIPTSGHSAAPASSSIARNAPSNSPSLLTSLPPPPVPPRLPPWVSAAKKPDPSVPIAKRRRVFLQHSSRTDSAPSASRIRFEGQLPRVNGDGDPKSPPIGKDSLATHAMNGAAVYSPSSATNGVVGGTHGRTGRNSVVHNPPISKKPQRKGTRAPLRHRIPFLARNIASGIRQLPQDRADALGFGQGRRKSTAAAGTLENWKHNCRYCTAKYPSQWKVDNHVRRNHFDNTDLFYCNQAGCEFGFATILSYQSHQQRRHGNANARILGIPRHS